MGKNNDPGLIHQPCSEKKGEKVFLVKDDGVPQTIYKAK
jgi:hypothetical protein